MPKVVQPGTVVNDPAAVHSLQQHLDRLRKEVQGWLDQALAPSEGVPQQLLEAMRYSVLAPGKRLRPLLVLLAAETCQQASTQEISFLDPRPAACAVEFLHVYSLVHDDLPAMDDDDLRRGQPTCHKQFGEALGILVGDALQALAFQTLAEDYPPEVGAVCCRELARAAGAAGMVGGQVDDLAWEKQDSSSHVPRGQDLEHLHLRKTGALIRASCVLGGLTAHARASWLEALDTYGRCLGLAFQITDDLLDVEGEASQAGKRVRKDAARGKLTYPGLLGIDESRNRANTVGQQAKEAIAPLGTPARPLETLVSLVLSRDR